MDILKFELAALALVILSNLKVVFKSGPTLCSLLTKVKDPLPEEKLAGVVDQIPCQCGKVYVGETETLGNRG